ncbi:MAG: o-succinylbenzoate--CoA ligase [Phototrophicales bacterium]|nr:MAG: o-succinylbenzoate--CoA ligase [Phototrophicales bacterium]
MTRTWIDHCGAANPDRPALISAQGMWTFGELNARIHTTAARLAAWGIQPSSRAAVLMPNGTPYVLAAHALMQLGAVIIPINTRLSASEVRYQLETAAPTLLIDSPDTEAISTAALPKKPLSSAAFPAIRSTHYDPAPLNPDADAAILFTSGTTGRPKGARLTVGNLLFSAEASRDRLGMKEGDRWLLTLPLYHIGGLSILYRSYLDGTTIVLYEGSFDPQQIADMLMRYQITLISLVPTQLHRMLEAGVDFPKSLRLILLGGAAASPDLLRRAFERGLPIATTYGLTETASQVATMLPEQARAKSGSVGKPLNGVRVQIISEDGRDLPAGEIGEIVVSGRNVMRGYLAHPDLDPPGTFCTGDLGYLDAEGDLWLVQRRSDLIISGGENIYPVEVENTLRAHPAIDDACVVGLPDAEWGQTPAAAIVLKRSMSATLDELDAHCKRHLARYKRPRRYLFVDHLPQTASGKVIRREVAALFSGESS